MLTEDWETDGAGTWASLKGHNGTRNYHYIEYYKQDGVTLDDEQNDSLAEQPYLREYYDLNADPYELQNRAGQTGYLFRQADMKAKLGRLKSR